MKYSSTTLKSNWLKIANAICYTLLFIFGGIYVASAGASVRYEGEYNEGFFNMVNNTPQPRNESIGQCILAPARDCTVIIHSGAGIHESESDRRQHLTVRFEGPDKPYDACHIYQEIDDDGKNDSRCFYDR